MLAALFALACGTSGSVGGDSGSVTSTGTTTTTATTSPTGTTTPTVPFTCSAGPVAQGDNQDFSVAGTARAFHADLPDVGADEPIAVIFSWHGVGDTVDNFRRFFGPDPNGFGVPLAVITPDDTNLSFFTDPPGLDWDMFDALDGDDNREALLFEEVLGCLAQDFTVDTQRIYSFGFSGGAVTTNLLHARYDELMAATLAMSGAFFNDPVEAKPVAELLGVLGIDVAWPDFSVQRGNALLTHGGASDTFGVGSLGIDFELSAQAAMPFLRAAGRTVVDCAHTKGHTNHPDLSEQDIVSFLLDHRAGTPSPYEDQGLPSFLADACTLVD